MRALSGELREATAKGHEALEALPFSQRLFSGSIDQTVYLAYLSGLQSVYSLMEAGIAEHRNHPIVGGLNAPALFRAEALERDISYWGGSSESGSDTPLTDPIKLWIDEDPVHLLPLAYVRYMGDLGGGQILLKQLSRTWNHPPDGPGFAFFNFDRPTAELRTRVRAVLDNEALSSPERSQILSLAVACFDLHIDWFRDLEARATSEAVS